MINKAKSVLKMPVFKALLTLAVPIILSNFLQSMYHMTDSFWLGRLGGAALASAAICSPLVFLVISIGIGFAIAGSTFVAQYYGAKNYHMVNRVAAQTILMISAVSIFFSILGFIFAPKILLLMGANSQIYDSALAFLRVSFIALIANFFFFVFQSIMRGIGKPIIPVFIVITTVLLNFILDPLFIFGFAFIPASGPMGAALATLFTQSLAAIAGLIILFQGKHGIELKLSYFKPDFKFIKKAFFIGLPSSIEGSSRNLAMIFMLSFVAAFGTNAVASYGAGSNIIQVAMMSAIGLSIASGTLVGQNLGAKDIKQAEKVAKLSAYIGFILLSFLGLFVFIFARYFISFFIPNDSEVIQGGSLFVRIVSLSFGFVSLQMIFGHVFTAAGKTHITMTLSVLSQWLIQIPLAYFLSKHTSLALHGVWLSLPISNILVAILAYFLYSRGFWKEGRLIEDDHLNNLA